MTRCDNSIDSVVFDIYNSWYECQSLTFIQGL